MHRSLDDPCPHTRRSQALGLFKTNSSFLQGSGASKDTIAGAMSTAGHSFYMKLQHALRVQGLISLNEYVKKDEYLSSCSQSRMHIN